MSCEVWATPTNIEILRRAQNDGIPGRRGAGGTRLVRVSVSVLGAGGFGSGAAEAVDGEGGQADAERFEGSGDPVVAAVGVLEGAVLPGFLGGEEVRGQAGDGDGLEVVGGK